MSVVNSTTYITPSGTAYNYSGDYKTCTIAVCPVELSVYGYRGSLPLSITIIVLYALCTVAQVFLGVKHRTWGFMTAMLLGCITEILGYVGRILMWQNPWQGPGFIMQIVLITIGPVFFSAAIYVLLAQICRYISPKAAGFPPVAFYWIFIPCDIISLILQAVGGAMSSTSNGSSNAGVNIALAGLSFQVATLFFFVTFSIDYAIRSRHVWRHALSAKFKTFILFLTAGTILIWIRCCYRVYELSQGYSSSSAALRDQSLFIALEAVMVIVAAWCLVVAHPGPVLAGNHINDGPAGLENRTEKHNVTSSDDNA